MRFSREPDLLVVPAKPESEAGRCSIFATKARAFVRLRRPSHISLCGQSNVAHCAAGAARTAKLVRKAQRRMRGVKRGHPAWRLPAILSGKSVSRGRVFRQHSGNYSCVALTPASMPSPVLAKRSRPRATASALPQLGHPCPRHVDSRCAACRPRLTAAQGPRVERRAILAPAARARAQP